VCGVAVAQSVRSYVLRYACPRSGLRDDHLGGLDAQMTGSRVEDIRRIIAPGIQISLELGLYRRRQGDMTVLPALALPNSQKTLIEVDLIPLKADRLGHTKLQPYKSSKRIR